MVVRMIPGSPANSGNYSELVGSMVPFKFLEVRRMVGYYDMIV